MVRVKICGITRAEDALAAEAFGADAVGFVFAKSPRRVSVVRAKGLITRLGPWISKTGVFVNVSTEEIFRTARRCGLDTVQLHGNEVFSQVRALRAKGLRVIKAFRIHDEKDLKRAAQYRADAILLDTAVAGIYGGTGKSFDWGLLRNFKSQSPVIVSGGLNGANVKKLLQRFTPYGVDVSSGVEKALGIKDFGQIKEFIRHAKKTA